MSVRRSAKRVVYWLVLVALFPVLIVGLIAEVVAEYLGDWAE